MAENAESPNGVPAENEEIIIFTGIPGAGQSGEIFEKRLFPILRGLGHVAMTADLAWMTKTHFKQHGRYIAEAEQYFVGLLRQDKLINGNEKRVRLAWSRGGNVAEWFAEDTDQIIHIASSFDDATRRPLLTEDSNMPPKNTPEYFKAVITSKEDPRLDEDMTRFDPDWSRQVFYSDPDPEMGLKEFLEIQNWAIDQILFKRQYRGAEDILKEWPKIPQDYIVCTKDQAINPPWQEWVARNWLKTEPYFIESGHSPMLSQPQKLARLILSIALGGRQSEQLHSGSIR